MDYSQNLNELKEFLNIKEGKKSITHNTNKTFAVLPFPTREPERAKFRNGFNGVVGEFCRIISDKSLGKKTNDYDVIEHILVNVTVKEEDKPYLQRCINMYLKNTNQSLLVFHPSVFKYYELSEGKDSKGEIRIAQFLRDVFCEDNSIKHMFNKNEYNNVMAKLIIENFQDLEDKKQELLYINQIPFIKRLFLEDVNYLYDHKKDFLNNFHLLLAYYYFFYITQLSLKLNKLEKAEFNKVSEMFYLLDWEKAAKSRQSYRNGYIRIKESNKKLIVHVNTLEHLNHIFGVDGKNYVQLQTMFDEFEENVQEEIINTIKKWVNEYRSITGLDSLDLQNKRYEELVFYLQDSLDKGILAGIKSRYALSIKSIGSKFFLKLRGSLGDLLNINQDFLLLLTAVCVKDEKMSLKKVFQEYEKRGIFFDRYSKESIVELFDKLNVIEKISDSGDAQYVKPIL